MAFTSQLFSPSSAMAQKFGDLESLPNLPDYSSFRSYPDYHSSSTSMFLPSNQVSKTPTVGSKRRLPSDDITSYMSPPSKLLCPSPPPPPVPKPQPSHECGKNCSYCSSLTNLDIAAYYWSFLAMKSYSQMKTSNMPVFDKFTSSFDTSFPKPPSSPSGSLSSVSSFDSEPLSPSSSVSSESSSKADLSKYACHVCQKTYSHPRLLNRHMQSHTPYKKHHCPRCGKGFNDAFDLKRHIRTHTGIKPFQCSLCEKSFTQRCSLEAHMTRVHSISQKFAFRERRPKLFVCEDCGETFQENNDFRQHEKDGKCPSRRQ